MNLKLSLLRLIGERIEKVSLKKVREDSIIWRTEESKETNEIADQFSFACFVPMVWSDIIIVNRVR